MPSLGADMETGRLVEWCITPGQTVARGDIVAVVETDKGAIEVEIFEPGVVRDLVVPEGDLAPVGALLATLDPMGEVTPDLRPTPEPPAAVSPKTPAPQSPAVAEPEPGPLPSPAPGAAGSRPPRIRATPKARRLAARRGISLAGISGTGPEGAILPRDLNGAPRVRPLSPQGDRMARAIAASMTRSNREIPHYYLSGDSDLTASLSWLADWNGEHGVDDRILPAALLLKATALAARKYPELNGTWQDGAYRPSEAVHLGVAISLRGGGLVAPALQDADQASLPELMAALSDLAVRARSGRLRSSEMTSPTLTVTSLGSQGVAMVLPMIIPPQVAMVGFGRISERPSVVDGAVVARPLVTSSLAADHRVSNGHRGALFLAAIDRLLQHPEKL